MDRTHTHSSCCLWGQKALFCISWPNDASENSGSSKSSFWIENKKSTLERVRLSRRQCVMTKLPWSKNSSNCIQISRNNYDSL